MENIKNLMVGYENLKEYYVELLEKKNNDIETWLKLYSDVSVLEYRSKDTELYYNVQSLIGLIRDKIVRISKRWKNMLNSFKEFLEDNNITTITNSAIEDFITFMYYELFDNSDSVEEIVATESDIRKKLLDYATDPNAFMYKEEEIKNKADSIFEVEVANKLVSEGYHIVQQYPVGAYRLDIVVIYEGRKVVIECDGERYHSGTEKVREDMQRQAILERIG